MAQTDILSSYETLLIYVEEVRSSMNLLYRWMNKDIKPKENTMERQAFLEQHREHFALLNLMMYRLDDLSSEHQEIIEKAIAEKE